MSHQQHLHTAHVPVFVHPTDGREDSQIMGTLSGRLVETRVQAFRLSPLSFLCLLFDLCLRRCKTKFGSLPGSYDSRT